jgi:hypothetical protein
MAHRTFTDRNGTEWQVWDIVPGTKVRHSLAGGWLTFESATEKRRLAPIPLYWVHAEDAELARLLDEAKVAPRLETGASGAFDDDAGGDRAEP